MAQSLQILTLSCKAVSEITISSLDAAGIQAGTEFLTTMETRQMYQLVSYDCLDLLRKFAPYEAIRTIYGELLKQLFWGYVFAVCGKKTTLQRILIFRIIKPYCNR